MIFKLNVLRGRKVTFPRIRVQVHFFLLLRMVVGRAWSFGALLWWLPSPLGQSNPTPRVLSIVSALLCFKCKQVHGVKENTAQEVVRFFLLTPKVYRPSWKYQEFLYQTHGGQSCAFMFDVYFCLTSMDVKRNDGATNKHLLQTETLTCIHIRWWHVLFREASKVWGAWENTNPKAEGPGPLTYLRNLFRKFSKRTWLEI